MKCRHIENGEVVWFNSLGLDKTKPVYGHDGTVVGYESLKSNNFSDKQQAVSDSLTQRLSVLKNELWYNITYGLSLVEKVSSKVFLDSEVTSIIMNHPDVVKILSFSSNIVGHRYQFVSKILSSYGNIDINSSDIQI